MKGKYLLGAMLISMTTYGVVKPQVKAASNDVHNVVFDVGNTVEIEVVDGSQYIASAPTAANVADDDTGVKTVNFGSNLSWASSPYDVLYNEASGVAIRVRTNSGTNHSLSVKANNFTGPTGHTKPLSDLKLKGDDFDTPFNTYSALTTTDQVVKATASVSGTGSAKYYRADYQLTVNPTDLAGSYSTTVTYTVAEV